MTDYRFVMVTENYAEDATASGGSYSVDLPVTNLQNRDQQIVARTSDTALASARIVFDLGSVKQVGAVVICNGNWTLDSLYRVQSSNVSDFSVLRYDSDWKSFPGCVVADPIAAGIPYGDPDFWTGVLSNTLLSDLPVNLIEILPDDEWLNGLAQYWRVLFDDTANDDGYLQYGYAFVGPVWRPTINFGEDNSAGLIPLADMSETLGGYRSWFERGVRRTFRATFALEAMAELQTKGFRLAVISRTSRPVFISFDPSDELHLQNNSFMASVKTLPAVQRLLATGRGTTVLDFEELL